MYKPSISSAGPGFPFSILWKSLCPITLGAGNDSVASCSIGFYKRSSKYLGMPNISAVPGIPACKLFMNQCLNSQTTLLSINHLSPSSGSLGDACSVLPPNYSLPFLLDMEHHSDPRRWNGVSQACLSRAQTYLLFFGLCHCSIGVMVQGFRIPCGSLPAAALQAG